MTVALVLSNFPYNEALQTRITKNLLQPLPTSGDKIQGNGWARQINKCPILPRCSKSSIFVTNASNSHMKKKAVTDFRPLDYKPHTLHSCQRIKPPSIEVLCNLTSEKGVQWEGENPQSNRRKALLTVFSAFVVSALLVAGSGPGGWRYYLAGGICAAISHSAGTPIDVIKTRQQVDESLEDLGLIRSGIKIVKDDGSFNVLLAGLGPTTFGYLFEGALKFGIYEVLKPSVKSMLAWSAAATSLHYLNSKVLTLLISGSIAGTIASIVLCPMEALRIRLVAEPEFASGGWFHGGLKMIETEGVRGLLKGLTAMMSKQIPYTVTKNVSFDLLTTMAYSLVRTGGYIITKEMKLLIPLISAMIASILSCVSSQPGDLLLSVVNAKEGNARTRDFAKDIWKKKGFRGFFVGMGTRFVHVGLMVTIQLFIYDIVKRFCGITGTGLDIVPMKRN